MLCVATFQYATAQSITASGTVKNEKGAAVAYALVQEADANTATYTDSLGFFTIPVKNSSSILVSAKGYRDEKVNAKDNLVVILKPGKSSFKGMKPADPNKIEATSIPNITKGFEQFNVAGTAVSGTGGGTYSSFSRKEDTRGSRYLFDNWVKGYVVDSKGNTIKNDNYRFNYDKINGALLLTQDQRAVVDVNKEQVKNFTVYDKLDQPMTFEYVSAIDMTHYSQVLSTGSKYKIYKFVKTTFIKSNYVSDGMASTGNRYDEYVDEPNYYIINVKTSEVKKISLKSKAIKQAFIADVDKVKMFYNDHKDDDIDEKFLSGLGDYLNQ